MAKLVPKLVALTAAAGILTVAITGCGANADQSASGSLAPGSLVPGSQSGIHTQQDAMFLMMYAMNNQQVVQFCRLVPRQAASEKIKAAAQTVCPVAESKTDQINTAMTEERANMANMDMGPDSYVIHGRQLLDLQDAHGEKFDQAWVAAMLDLAKNTTMLAQGELQFGESQTSRAVAQTAMAQASEQTQTFTPLQ